MSASSRFSFGQSLGLLLLLLVLTLIPSSCTKLPIPLGGGTNVAANTQVGAQNNQTLGTSTVMDQTFKDTKINKVTQGDNKVSTDSIENVTVNETPMWLILLALLGWFLPTPQSIGRGIGEWLKKTLS